MSNLKFKIFLSFTIILFLMTSVVFSTNVQISQPQENIITNSDVYMKNEESVELTKMIIGNAFVSTKDFVLSPFENGGIISGNLFVRANNVTIKSDSTYLEDGTVESTNVSSKIFGNAFVMTDKFVLEPGCSIEGDLYIVAKEIDISESAVIYGNIFASSELINLSGQIAGNAYISSGSFNLKHNGLILQDLCLNCNLAELSGIIRRNANINIKNLKTNDDFLVYGNLEVNASSIDFDGEVDGNAKLNAKNISFNNNSLIKGNLDYSSSKSLDIAYAIIKGETNFSELKSFKISSILPYIIGIVSLITYTILIYLIIKKFFKDYLYNISKFTWIDLLKFLGIGLLILLVTPIIVILLFFIRIGYLLAFVLLALYFLLLLISVSTSIIAFAEFTKSKFDKLPTWAYVIILSAILYALSLIPFAGFIISVLILLLGLGMLVVKNMKK